MASNPKKSYFRMNWASLLVAAFLASVTVLASLNQQAGFAFNWPKNWAGFALSLLYFMILAFIFYQFIKLLAYFVEGRGHGAHFAAQASLSSKYRYLIPVGLALAWLPYLLLTWPGVLTWDGADQLNSFFQVAMPAQNIHFYGIDYNQLNQQFYLSNHHPYLTSLILGNLFDFGKLLAGTNGGTAAIVGFDYLLLVTTLSLLVWKIGRFSRGTAWITWAFFAFFPAFPIMVVSVNKTALALAALALFIVAALSYFQHAKGVVGFTFFTLAAIFLLLVRNDSLLLLIFYLLALLCLRISGWKKQFAGLILALACWAAWSKLLLPAASVLPTESVEVMALPSQQMARVLKENPSGVSYTERQELAKFADTKLMRNSYNPLFYDPVKHSIYYYPKNFWQKGKDYQSNMDLVKGNYFNQHKADYLKLWWQIGQKNLGLYFAAGFNDAYQYFTPVHNPVQSDLALVGGLVPYENTTLFKGYSARHSKQAQGYQDKLNRLYQRTGWNWLFKSGLWGLLMLLLLGTAIQARAKLAILLASLGLAVLAIATISPVNGLNRYIYPLYLLIPVVWAALIDNRFKNSDE
ncbi:DUF6020 family protein [Eupransor demetentiae]|uniref:Glycosyltransferase RgtA/B/C/D-like domain-containing protein n=1 Tax=Eupransor demetentiae TaxID=3109584 RepID=A0ABP0ER39_9LACO|nr:hypothetical protein R54876_GBNLAHCA_00228 [Lactobacillaceae bacterium LMG 33000]